MERRVRANKHFSAHRWAGAAFACLWLWLLTSCGGPGGPPAAEPVGDTAAADAGAQQPGQPVLQSMEIMDFDVKHVPWGVQVKGKAVDGLHWRDRSGEYLLVISEEQRGMVADEDFLLSIFAQRYRKGEDGPVLDWEIKEYNTNVFSGPEYAPGTLELTDLDGDVVGETAFLYTIDTDGADPMGLKLLMHVQGKKYAIRGQLAGMDYDRGKVEKKEFDPAFSQIPQEFKDFASAKWDKFEREFYKGWPPVEE